MRNICSLKRVPNEFNLQFRLGFVNMLLCGLEANRGQAAECDRLSADDS